jgi:hypothetical protein
MSGIVFLYQFIPSIIFFIFALFGIIAVTFIFPMMGIDLSDPVALESLKSTFLNPPVMILSILAGLFFVALFLMFQLTCSYLARLGLSYIIQNQKFTFSSLLHKWSGVWSWIGTGITVSVYFIVLIFLAALLSLVLVYINEWLVIIPIFTTGIVCIFLSVALAFTFPIYFLEGTRYFQAAEKSRAIVRGRWWQVFGNFFLLGLAIILVTLILFAWETASKYTFSLLPDTLFEFMFFTAMMTLGGVVFMVFQSAINIAVQLFAILFTFELYQDYSKTDIHPKK